MSEDASSPPRRTLLTELWIRMRIAAYALPTRALDVLVLLPRPRLLVAYLRLWAVEWTRTPYRWPRSFETVRVLQKAGQLRHEVVYGETPVSSALLLFRRAGLTAQGRLVDLTAGRGRPLLAARWWGAHAIGVELVADHVEAAGPLLRAVDIELEVGDGVESAHIASATHLFISWIDFEETTKSRFRQALQRATEGTRLVVLHTPLEPAQPATSGDPRLHHDGWTLLERRSVLTNWGWEPAFIYERSA